MIFWPRTVADRPGRSTVRSTKPRAGRSLRSTDVHNLVHVWQTQGRSAGRSTGRSTGPESFALCIWAVDRAVDRTKEPCSLYLGGRPGGRPDCPNGHIYDRWRSTGRSTASLSGCQISLTASFLFGLYKPHFFGILVKVFWANFFPLSGFKKKFSKVFKEQKDQSYLFLSVLLFSKKIGFWELVSCSSFLYQFGIFLRDFLWSKHFVFPHLSYPLS